ncbi:hypothetical protein SAMN04487989_101521 [Bizionia echini]|uniref:Uncharacterized protein n=1 Tax=Bizionia echini TaxID=649333 RepID=A0A1I4Z513_9FLAO|nr:hypothetical protein [Bizionia echini]MBP92552.1 hypothetical protein [Flavobacteriaceae bacterium]SFN45365.1 hypothetical protein SAMN04487989_101521 [Bizionia echini]|tara:strand:- start:101 stop:520 length:420 start_codon:yes stop_codon:yes gene_type:complete
MLKKGLCSLCLILGFIGFSQEKVKVETPLILKKLFYKDSVMVNNYVVKFSDVVTDSRCPKNVTCVWAGEVVFKLEVIKNKTRINIQTFKIPPTSYTIQERKTLTIEGEELLYLYNVLPFPEADKNIEKTDYYLQFSGVN